jgi:hypothetical protein
MGYWVGEHEIWPSERLNTTFLRLFAETGAIFLPPRIALFRAFILAAPGLPEAIGVNPADVEI